MQKEKKKERKKTGDTWKDAYNDWLEDQPEEDRDKPDGMEFIKHIRDNYKLLPNDFDLKKMENFAFQLLKETEQRMQQLNKDRHATYKMGNEEMPFYTEKDWTALFNMLQGRIDILYMCITGHDNNYDPESLEEDTTKNKNIKK